MKELPILFKAPMVRAILDGRKTQTRRVMKPQPYRDQLQSPLMNSPQECWVWETTKNHKWFAWDEGSIMPGKFDPMIYVNCPYGQPGDRLWVKETFLFRNNQQSVVYRADLDPVEAAGVGGMYGGWKPSIYMPRSASRITLDITKVRVQRVQEILEEDAKAEGIEGINPDLFAGPWKALAESSRGKASHKIFRHLWDSINGELGYPWASNPWVWAITFKRQDQ